ncbi:MAG: ankyrin repeat domain-containing protein [Francisellaceae bacterium]|jgi:hypothetical protein|nr:ankyrin repeat domain-containing protein [Francisellaceae bacterium]MBT6208259.1 ankyrin repeat domain-containing protein [Francisellaceae bacterium]MBT6539022.1 ankyrin repeat domain-containing protein [Francisellaceae bacterium]
MSETEARLKTSIKSHQINLFFENLNNGNFTEADTSLNYIIASGLNLNDKYFYVKSTGINICGNLLFAIAYSEYRTVSCPEEDHGAHRKITFPQYQQLIEKLVVHGCDLASTDSFFWQTPLMMAIGYGNTFAAFALLEFCSPKIINFTSRPGLYSSTALILSIQRLNDPLTLELINRGADVNITSTHIDHGPKIPLPYAGTRDRKEIQYSIPRMVERSKEVTVTPLQWTFIFASSPNIITKLCQCSAENMRLLALPLADDSEPNSPYIYLKLKHSNLSPIVYNNTMFTQKLHCMEAYAIIAHYWNDVHKYFFHRQNRLVNLYASLFLPNFLSGHWPKTNLRTFAFKYQCLNVQQRFLQTIRATKKYREIHDEPKKLVIYNMGNLIDNEGNKVAKLEFLILIIEEQLLKFASVVKTSSPHAIKALKMATSSCCVSTGIGADDSSDTDFGGTKSLEEIAYIRKTAVLATSSCKARKRIIASTCDTLDLVRIKEHELMRTSSRACQAPRITFMSLPKEVLVVCETFMPVPATLANSKKPRF